MDGIRMMIDFPGEGHHALGSDDTLASIDFAPRHHRDPANPRRLTVGLPCLSPRRCVEVWRCADRCRHGWHGEIGYAHGSELLFAHLLVEEQADSDLSRLTFDAYRTLLAFARSCGFPYLWRMWNFMESIYGTVDGLERYQAFCVGRARAFAQADLPTERLPAATAIGTDAPGFLVYLLASTRAGMPVENPGQVSAYRYPAIYSPRPPGFARAMLVGDAPAGRLLISGTASIVGYRSVHTGSLGAQLHQTLVNLERLVGAASVHRQVAPGRPRLLRVYLRNALDRERIEPALRAWAGAEWKIQYLRGDVCRRELLLEIEGVY